MSTYGKKSSAKSSDDGFDGRATIPSSKSKKSSSASKRRSKSSTAKKSSSQRTSSQKNASNQKPEQKTSRFPKEVRFILLLFTSIALILAMCNKFGKLGIMAKNLFLGLFGAVGYIIPIFFLVATIHLFIKGTLSPHKHRYLFIAAGFIFISGLHTLSFDFSKYNDPQVKDFFDTLWYSGRECYSGGLIGALMALPLKTLVAGIGTGIILTGLTIVCFVTATGTEPFSKLFRAIADAVSGFIQKVKEEREHSEKINDIIESAEEKTDTSPKQKRSKSIASQKKDEEDSDHDISSDDFKIVLYDEKKGELSKADTVSKKDKSEENFAESVEIPEDIKKMAMTESGGVEEEKADITPIAVTEDEIDSDYIEYTFPPIDLLAKNKSGANGQDRPEDLRTQAKKLVDTLQSFGVEAKVLEVNKGPTVTRFELQPSAGVKVSKIVNLADDIALNLAAFGVRIEAPIPGKAAVGIEIPNKNTSMVCLRDVIESEEFRKFSSKTAFAMGKDISGQPIVSDISKMPHMLIAGATGSGKSVCINSLITSILYKADPNQVKLILIDPKVVELGVYNGIPHLLIPVVTDPRRAAGALNWAVQEMVKRYSMFATANVRDLKGYNEYASLNNERELEQIIIVIDELADLMMVAPHEVEDAICRLAQMARAAGMHLVIATQRPSVDVITGLIKANVPSRIAFSVSSQIDSRTILDMGGAEKLLGKGDMLFLPMGASKPKRLQGAFVSDKEIERIVEFVKADSKAHYNEDIIEHIENGTEDRTSTDDSDADDLLPQAIEIVVEIGQASASLLQRKLKVGYSRAGRLIDQLEERGIIGPHEGSKPRKVLMSKSEYQEMMLSNMDD